MTHRKDWLLLNLPFISFQIRVFSLFRKWKAFSVWRTNVRSKKVQNCKKQLNENLFIVNPVGYQSKSIHFVNIHHHELIMDMLLRKAIFLNNFLNFPVSASRFTERARNVLPHQWDGAVQSRKGTHLRPRRIRRCSIRTT